jgi:nitrite reductase/ring-hydroxylating ferredoxin subunit
MSKYLPSYTTYILLLALTISFLGSCKKDEKSSQVAQVPVNFFLYLNDPANVELNAVGGWLYINGGTKGIIVYRQSNEEFTALERNCPYDPNKSCSLVEELSGIIFVDSCCLSQFSIYDGSIVNGPATQSMYRYRSVLNGSTLHIYD